MTESSGPAQAPLVPDQLVLAVPRRARVLVVSDIHLGGRATPTSLLVSESLARDLDAWATPGVFVLAGDIFELLGDRTTDPRPALAAHRRFREALAGWTLDAQHRVVVLTGNHDGSLAWCEPAVRALESEFRAQMAITVDLEIETAGGVQRVRIEHGHRFDSTNAFTDPRDPLDTPLGHHVVSEFLPALDLVHSPWLRGLGQLIDGVDAPAFAASRIAYRRVARYLGWLAVPFIVLGGLRIGLGVATVAGDYALDPLVSGWLQSLSLIGIGILADVFLLVAILVVIGKRTFGSVDELGLGERGIAQNRAARGEAERLLTFGFAGLVTGHTHYPELTGLGAGFYANSGCGDVIVERRPARLHLPPVFASIRRVSWIEMEAGPELTVRLLLGESSLDENTRLERFVMRPVELAPSPPTLVASRPGGPNYPLRGQPTHRSVSLGTPRQPVAHL